PLVVLRRPQPGSPLFPYTTLFRSVVAEREELVEEIAARRDQRAQPGDDLLAEAHQQRHHAPLTVAARECGELLELVDSQRRVVADRKSTRLNSSHLGISYAVFCLK